MNRAYVVEDALDRNAKSTIELLKFKNLLTPFRANAITMHILKFRSAVEKVLIPNLFGESIGCHFIASLNFSENISA